MCSNAVWSLKAAILKSRMAFTWMCGELNLCGEVAVSLLEFVFCSRSSFLPLRKPTLTYPDACCAVQVLLCAAAFAAWSVLLAGGAWWGRAALLWDPLGLLMHVPDLTASGISLPACTVRVQLVFSVTGEGRVWPEPPVRAEHHLTWSRCGDLAVAKGRKTWGLQCSCDLIHLVMQVLLCYCLTEVRWSNEA